MVIKENIVDLTEKCGLLIIPPYHWVIVNDLAIITKWTLKERKQREKFQATIRNIPDSMTLAALWKDSRPHSFLSAVKGLKSFKIIQTAKGDRKFIGYFEKWVDMRTALDNQYTWEQQNSSKNSKKKPQETKSDKKSKKDKKDKSCKASRLKILVEIINVLRKLI
uniref:Uncharacterized protein n=1 Tax=Rhizophagus irregularis (strain DAOM 181602 / DAOM 197198 / MUCL 43194) TaxID=747089 RepID=U9UX54_RHIID